MIEELLAAQGLMDTLGFGCLVFLDNCQLGGLYVLLLTAGCVAITVQCSLYIARIVKGTAKKNLIARIICNVTELGY